MTLDEAVALGLEYYRGLHAARMRSDAAAAGLAEAAAAAWPAVELSGGYTYLSSVPEFSIPSPSPTGGVLVLNPSINDTYQIALEARQPLYSGGKITGARDAAEARAFAAMEALRGARADLVLGVTRAYWGLVRAHDMRRVVEDDEALVEAHLADVQRLLDEGMATTNDALKVKARLSAARYRRIEADHAALNASMALATLIGLPLEGPLEAATALAAPSAAPTDAEALTARALEDRPELRALRLDLEAARACAGIARADRKPQVALGANYLYARPNSRIFPAEDRFNDTWSVSAGLTYKVWDGGAVTARVLQAEARIREAEDALALARDAAALEVRRALLAVEAAADRIAVAAVGMEQAGDDLRMARDRFVEGLVLNTEVLDSEVALLEARLRNTQALADHAVALAELDRAIGR